MREAKQSNPDGVGEGEEQTSPTTLFEAVIPQCIDFATMKKKYPFVATTEALIGSTPHGLAVFLLFRGAFNVHAIGTQAFMNMPMTMLGLGADLSSLLLAAVAASERASCSFCADHCCSIMKRTGAADGLVARENRTPVQSASAAFGASLGAMPAEGVEAAVREMRKHFSRDDVEWHALQVGAMGYLNTFNDIFQTATDKDSVSDVEPLGWKTMLGMLWTAPSAIAYEIRNTWGIPGEKKAVHEYLSARLGGSLSVVDDIKFPKARKAVAMIMQDHVAGEDCTFSRSFKYAVGKAFASCVGNEKLEKDMGDLFMYEKEKGNRSHDIGSADGLPELLKNISCSAADCGADWTEKVMLMLRADEKIAEGEVHALLLCLSAFAQPFRTDAQFVSVVAEGVTPPDIVEIVSWMSVLVMLNRTMSYYAFADSSDE